MQEKITTFAKRPPVFRALYFICALILAFFLGVIAHATVQIRGNDPVTQIPSQPIPLALRYNGSGTQNVSDFTPALGSEMPSGDGLGAFIASRTGTKYYPADCGSVSRIKEENRVYFDTEQAAIDKGYERTDACQ